MTAKHINRINLQRAIVEILPLQGGKMPGLKAADICSSFEEYFPRSKSDGANRRKLERELKDLIEEGRAVVGDVKARPNLYLRPASEDEDEFDSLLWAYTVGHIEDHLESVLPHKKLEAAIKRLQDPDAGVRLSDSKFRIVPDTLRLLPAAFDPAVLAAILQALMEGKTLNAVYRDKAGKQTRPTLHLQAALHRGPRFYVFALKNEETEPVRMYVLHRFTSASVGDEPVRVAPGFDLDEAERTGQVNFSSGEMTQLAMLARGYVADLLRECPMGRDQQIIDEPAGNLFDCRVSVTVPKAGQLLRWLLGCGDNVKVLEPLEIAKAVAAQSGKTAALYSAG